MSLQTVNQLYQDINTLAQTMADKSADVSMVTMFNANLAEAQHTYQGHRLLSTLMPAQNEAPIGDLLIRTGQLLAILQEETHKAQLESLRRANQERRGGIGPRGTGA